MLWFKHYSDSLDDPFIQSLFDKFSHRGYVAYFGLIEIIAKESGKNLTGKLSINPTYIARKLRIRRATLALIYDYCATLSKLQFDNHGKEWHFNMPKMLELKDNYTRDLEATTKKPSKQTETEEEVEKDKEKEKNIKHMANFGIFWDAYDYKIGKAKALKAWAKVKVPLTSILPVIEKQKKVGGPLSPEKREYWPHPATWLNGQRWEDEQAPEATLPESMKRGK